MNSICKNIMKFLKFLLNAIIEFFKLDVDNIIEGI